MAGLSKSGVRVLLKLGYRNGYSLDMEDDTTETG